VVCDKPPQKKRRSRVSGAAFAYQAIDRELGEITAKRFHLFFSTGCAKNYFLSNFNALQKAAAR
jgi:hypothetical protein